MKRSINSVFKHLNYVSFALGPLALIYYLFCEMLLCNEVSICIKLLPYIIYDNSHKSVWFGPLVDMALILLTILQPNPKFHKNNHRYYSMKAKLSTMKLCTYQDSKAVITNHNEILHIPRQQSCLGMCKFHCDQTDIQYHIWWKWKLKWNCISEMASWSGT